MRKSSKEYRLSVVETGIRIDAYSVAQYIVAIFESVSCFERIPMESFLSKWSVFYGGIIVAYLAFFIYISLQKTLPVVYGIKRQDFLYHNLIF